MRRQTRRPKPSAMHSGGWATGVESRAQRQTRRSLLIAGFASITGFNGTASYTVYSSSQARNVLASAALWSALLICWHLQRSPTRRTDFTREEALRYIHTARRAAPKQRASKLALALSCTVRVKLIPSDECLTDRRRIDDKSLSVSSFLCTRRATNDLANIMLIVPVHQSVTDPNARPSSSAGLDSTADHDFAQTLK